MLQSDARREKPFPLTVRQSKGMVLSFSARFRCHLLAHHEDICLCVPFKATTPLPARQIAQLPPAFLRVCAPPCTHGPFKVNFCSQGLIFLRTIRRSFAGALDRRCQIDERTGSRPEHLRGDAATSRNSKTAKWQRGIPRHQTATRSARRSALSLSLSLQVM